MTFSLISTLLLSLVFVNCNCRSLSDEKYLGHEIISEGGVVLFSSRNSRAGEALLDEFAVPGCTAFRPSEEEREQIAVVHNDFRRRIARGYEMRGDVGPQPTAKNMRLMIYDTRLEDLALQWVSQCAIDLPRDCPIEGYTSIHRSMLQQTGRVDPFKITDSIKHRYNKVSYMHGTDAITKFNGRNSHTGRDVRSYAILVNAKTYGVGCAQSYYEDKSTGDFQRFLICNYGNGLSKRQPLYEHGKPCAGLKDECCDRGLVRGSCW